MHQQFMPCWETARQQLTLVRNADLILYTSGNVGSKDLEQLHFTNFIVKHYKKAKYEEGAIQAMVDAFGSKGHQEKWFDRYDWVVRLNPDVLIMDDNWLLETMGNSSVDAIFVNCNGKINTDFFVVRPQVIQTNLADTCTSGSGDPNAETHLTCVVSNIISSGRYVWATRKISEASLLHVSVEVYEVCRTVNSPILTRCDTFRLCQLQTVVKSLNVKMYAPSLQFIAEMVA